MNSAAFEDPALIGALAVGFLLCASLLGGLFRTAMLFLLLKRLLFIGLPFAAGAGGVLYFLQ